MHNYLQQSKCIRNRTTRYPSLPRETIQRRPITLSSTAKQPSRRSPTKTLSQDRRSNSSGVQTREPSPPTREATCKPIWWIRTLQIYNCRIWILRIFLVSTSSWQCMVHPKSCPNTWIRTNKHPSLVATRSRSSRQRLTISSSLNTASQRRERIGRRSLWTWTRHHRLIWPANSPINRQSSLQWQFKIWPIRRLAWTTSKWPTHSVSSSRIWSGKMSIANPL